MKCILVENGKFGLSWWDYNADQGEVNMGTQVDNKTEVTSVKLVVFKWEKLFDILT